MAAEDVRSHELALLLGGRCRRCAERLAGGTALRGLPCKACGAPTAFTTEERLELHDLFDRRSRPRTWLAVTAVLLANLAVGWFPLLSSILLAASIIWVRVAVVGPGIRLFGLRRRLVTLWTLRLLGGGYIAAMLIVTESLTLVPLIGTFGKALVGASQTAFAAWFASRYVSWQAGREARGQAVSWFEWAALASIGVMLFGGVVVAVFAVQWILAKLSWVQQYLG